MIDFQKHEVKIAHLNVRSEVHGDDPVFLGQDRDGWRPPQVAGAEAVDEHDRARGRVAAAGGTGFEPPDRQVADLCDVARLPGHG